MMMEFTLWDIIRNLLFAMRWTLALSLVALGGGALFTMLLLTLRLTCGARVNRAISLYVNLFQGTPILMQLFLVFFAFPLVGIEVSPWTAASVCLILYASAYLLDIWYSAVRSLPRGQWEACRVLGLSFPQTMMHVVMPQAVRLAAAPSVGFIVQLIKNTSLTSVIGFEEMTKVGMVLTNATFEPFKIYGLLALGYFLLCFPLSRLARRLEGTSR